MANSIALHFTYHRLQQFSPAALDDEEDVALPFLGRLAGTWSLGVYSPSKTHHNFCNPLLKMALLDLLDLPDLRQRTGTHSELLRTKETL